MSDASSHGKPGKAAMQGGAGRSRRCPVCGRPSVQRFRPFCSSRCADVDLGRWFKATYAIPTEDKPADDGGDDGVEEGDG